MLYGLSSNNIKNIITEPLVVENIIHEIAHFLEENYPSQIYGDGKLEKEYNGKKNRLFQILKMRDMILVMIYFSLMIC